MAEPNALSPTVDIISRENGKAITSYSQSADRVVNLSQSSVVKINASPESVNFYERQGGRSYCPYEGRYDGTLSAFFYA